jgi:hypothetical protein
VLKDKAFEKTRCNASFFARAQQIAKEAYCSFPASGKSKAVWYRLRNHVQELVRNGKKKEEILTQLRTGSFLSCKKAADPLSGILPQVHIKKVDVGNMVIAGREKNRTREPGTVYPQHAIRHLRIRSFIHYFAEVAQYAPKVPLPRYVYVIGSPAQRIGDQSCILFEHMVFRQITFAKGPPAAETTSLQTIPANRNIPEVIFRNWPADNVSHYKAGL